uniref:Uncharacterized protein n=1 Tax=Ananas comosus var. bracteatus TaxID=296719 RepID=A0A6V7PUG4_ANACO|nr:unnamed protein product [Ananas comosus var. bracteatus]
MKPLMPLQYGRAWADFVLRLHDAFRVAKGELLCGYQSAVMRDPRVFDDPDSFVPERFLGERGKGYSSICIGPMGRRPSGPPRRTSSARPRTTWWTRCTCWWRRCSGATTTSSATTAGWHSPSSTKL